MGEAQSLGCFSDGSVFFYGFIDETSYVSLTRVWDFHTSGVEMYFLFKVQLDVDDQARELIALSIIFSSSRVARPVCSSSRLRPWL